MKAACRRRVRDSPWRAGHQARGQRCHHPVYRRHPLPGAAGSGHAEGKYGLSAEVIDARSIVPFDYTKVIESVKKTGRILITGDACEELRHAPDGLHPSRNWPLLPGRPAGGGGRPQLDHPRPRDGRGLLPAAQLDPGRHPPAHAALKGHQITRNFTEPDGCGRTSRGCKLITINQGRNFFRSSSLQNKKKS